MSQLGMQLPGGQVKRSTSPNVYTALLFVAVLALAGGLTAAWLNGSKLAPDGKPWQTHESGQGGRAADLNLRQ